ncbi:hypothetical protein BZM27_40490 [Paraburkholderia steynii]|uniref:Uncharacterized protein n=1 Tax=Paraburkholderia steynii TaxID=1245441 RepID=A0A4V2NGD4_9BURK|nr:hypothetical protein BZM27_40490 [Paraburkholderia steynii]
MSNRRFKVFEYRQVLVRMRQGDSDRDIAGAHPFGSRPKMPASSASSGRGRPGSSQPWVSATT